MAIRALTGSAYAARAIVHRALGNRGKSRGYGAMARVYVAGGDPTRVD
jgi:hypothetical protein